MEEEGGEENTGDKEREGVGQDVFIEGPSSENTSSAVQPDQPGHVTDCGDGNVDISESRTESHSGLSAITVNVQAGESKEGDSRQDKEEGMSVENLQGGFVAEIQSREGREKKWEKYQENDGGGIILKYNT